tara:strand:- start:5650 stop:5898 length:249 start_codon:yes stop_codon:yes gene_type:complete
VFAKTTNQPPAMNLSNSNALSANRATSLTLISAKVRVNGQVSIFEAYNEESDSVANIKAAIRAEVRDELGNVRVAILSYTTN